MQIFRELKSLEELNLSHNQLVSFLDNHFVHNKHLRHLNFADNRIEKVSKYGLYGLKELEFLDFSDNHLSTIDRNAFDTLENLKHLVLDRNRLGNLSTSVFAALRNLHSLRLSENLFTSLPNGIFANQYQLNELYLDSTGIERLGNWISRADDMVSPLILRNLKFLAIRNNRRLTEIDFEFFMNIQNLEVLYLSDNALTSIPREIGYVKQLRLLDVSNNSLSYIPEQISHLPVLRHLNLLHNDYSCDCHMIWIVKWVEDLQRANKSSPELLRLSELKCRHGYLGDILPVLQHLNCMKPVLLYHSDSKMYKLKEDALLECSFAGNPHPEIVWVTPWQEVLRHSIDPDSKPVLIDDNGKYQQTIKFEFVNELEEPNRLKQPVPPGITVLENGFLKIHKISRRDSGLYTCFAKNNMGNTSVHIR